MRPERLYLTDIAVNWSIVWVATTEDVPFLREKIARVLAEEYGNERIDFPTRTPRHASFAGKVKHSLA